MTREEAIQALKDLAEIYVRYGCDDKWIMALQMAIEALSADAEQTEYKLPGHDEVMDALDKLTLKPKKESEEDV